MHRWKWWCEQRDDGGLEIKEGGPDRQSGCFSLKVSHLSQVWRKQTFPFSVTFLCGVWLFILSSLISSLQRESHTAVFFLIKCPLSEHYHDYRAQRVVTSLHYILLSLLSTSLRGLCYLYGGRYANVTQRLHLQDGTICRYITDHVCAAASSCSHTRCSNFPQDKDSNRRTDALVLSPDQSGPASSQRLKEICMYRPRLLFEFLP